MAGRNEEHNVSSRDLVEAISKNDPGKDVHYAQDLSAAESHLREMVQPGDVVLVMGAGDIDEVARRLS